MKSKQNAKYDLLLFGAECIKAFNDIKYFFAKLPNIILILIVSLSDFTSVNEQDNSQFLLGGTRNKYKVNTTSYKRLGIVNKQLYFDPYTSDLLDAWYTFLIALSGLLFEWILLAHFTVISKSNHRNCSIKKVFLKNFAIFMEKHLCWSLFLQGLRPPVLNTYLEEHLRAAASKFQQQMQSSFCIAVVVKEAAARIYSLLNALFDTYSFRACFFFD